MGVPPAAQAVLLRIGKADARRGALARRALFLESYPESPPRGVVERVRDAIS